MNVMQWQPVIQQYNSVNEVLLPRAILWQLSSAYTIESRLSGLDVSFSQGLFDCRSESPEASLVTCAVAAASNLDSPSNLCEQHQNEGQKKSADLKDSNVCLRLCNSTFLWTCSVTI